MATYYESIATATCEFTFNDNPSYKASFSASATDAEESVAIKLSESAVLEVIQQYIASQSPELISEILDITYNVTKLSTNIVSELYTYTYDENSITDISVGSNAVVTNEMYNLYKNDVMVGRILFTSGGREHISDNVNYENYLGGIYLNNNKNIINFNFGLTTTLSSSEGFPETEILTKATYSSGIYQGKDVTVNIKFLKDSKRDVIITYNV
jgi:hypothetical protein